MWHHQFNTVCIYTLFFLNYARLIIKLKIYRTTFTIVYYIPDGTTANNFDKISELTRRTCCSVTINQLNVPETNITSKLDMSQIHTGLCVLDACNVSKVSGVRYAETAHSVGMSPFLQHYYHNTFTITI